MDQQEKDELWKKCDVCMYGSVTVGTKGQVVIPKEVRDILDINPGDTLVVVTKHNKAIGMVKSDNMETFMAYLKAEMEK